MTKKEVTSLISKDTWMMSVLKTVNKLELFDWWIGAGFVRSKVWDYLHDYKKKTELPDVDVIYFNREDYSENTDKNIEKLLTQKRPDITWSVKNQARMHKLHKHSPYKSSTEALSKWAETATCVAVTLDSNGKIVLNAPLGLKDLSNLILRPNPSLKKLDNFYKRIEDKRWLEKWPKLKIVVKK